MRISRLFKVVLGSLTVVAATASPAWAHGSSEQIPPVYSPVLLRSLYFVLAALCVVVALRMPHLPSRSHSWNVPVRARQFVGLTMSTLSLTVLLVTFGVSLAGSDPFGTIGRGILIFWFGLLSISTLLGNFWSLFAPDAILRFTFSRNAKPADVFDEWLACGMAFVLMWFVLAYDQPASDRPLMWMLLAYCITLLFVVVTCRPEPFTVIASTLSRRSVFRISGRASNEEIAVQVPFLDSNSNAEMDTSVWRSSSQFGLYVVVLGGLVFAVLRDQQWWALHVGALQGWSEVGKWSLGLLGCIAGVVMVSFLTMWMTTAVTGLNNRVFVKTFLTVFLPLISGLVVVEELTLVLVSLQNELFVAWDPFDRGWRPFGSAQGVSVQLTGVWDLRARLIAAFVVPLLVVFVATQNAKSARLNTISAIPISVVLVASGFVLLHYTSGI